MSIFSRLATTLRRDRQGRRAGENDAPVDPTQGADHEQPVGRASGDESPDTAVTGAERRTGREGTVHEGALRDD
jgi:hypothetical protein